MCNIEGVKKYIRERRIKNETELCEMYIKERLISGTGYEKDIELWRRETAGLKEPYFEIYKKYIPKGSLLNRFYDDSVFTEESLSKWKVMYKGECLEYGFCGITIKEEESGWYHVWLRDGSKGVLLSKSYRGVPEKERVLRDSIFEICDKKIAKRKKGMSICDIFKRKERGYKNEQTYSTGIKSASVQRKGLGQRGHTA